MLERTFGERQLELEQHFASRAAEYEQLEERTSSLHDREKAMSQLTGELDGFRSREAQRDEKVAEVRQLFERLQPYLGDLERNLMSDFEQPAEQPAEQPGGGSAVESGGGSAADSAAGSTGGSTGEGQ